VNTEEVGFDVVAAPVEVAEAGADSGDASVEKAKSDYICRSMLSGKGPTVGFYKERAAAASATRSSSSSSSSSSNVRSSVSACCLD